MLGVVITTVESSFFPGDSQLILVHSVLHPIKTHIHCFGSFLFYDVIGNSTCRGVVSDDVQGWLWAVHLFESDDDVVAFASVEEDATEFGF